MKVEPKRPEYKYSYYCQVCEVPMNLCQCEKYHFTEELDDPRHGQAEQINRENRYER